jgi:hypothetical protein
VSLPIQTFSVDETDIVKYCRAAKRFYVTINEEFRDEDFTIYVNVKGNGISSTTYSRNSSGMDQTGKINTPLTMPVGEYILTVTANNTLYSATSHVTILSHISEITFDNIENKIWVTYVDDDGNPLVGADETISIDDVLYARTTNQEGKLFVKKSSLPAGIHTVIAYYQTERKSFEFITE